MGKAPNHLEPEYYRLQMLFYPWFRASSVHEVLLVQRVPRERR